MGQERDIRSETGRIGIAVYLTVHQSYVLKRLVPSRLPLLGFELFTFALASLSDHKALATPPLATPPLNRTSRCNKINFDELLRH